MKGKRIKPTFPSWTNWGYPILCGLTILTISRLLAFPLYDPDFWWHLVSGKVMVEQGRLIHADLFSHTMQGKPWVNFEWIFQIVLYALYSAGGFTAIYWVRIFSCLFVVGTLAYLIYLCGIRREVLLGLLWLIFLVLRPRLFERAELMTLMGLTLLLIFIVLIRRQHAIWSKHVLWLSFLLSVIWVNTHAGIIYGLGVLVLACFGTRLAKDSTEIKRRLDWLFAVFLLGFFINPYGINIFHVFFDHLFFLQISPQMIKEWYRPTFMMASVFWVFTGISFALAILVIIKKEKTLYFWLPMTIVFAIWGMKYFRNTALLAIVGAPFLAFALLRWKNNSRVIKSVASLFVILAAFSQLMELHVWWPSEIVNWRRFPTQSAQFLLDKNIQGPIYNRFHDGGYLEWVFGPDRLVMSDGRYIFLPLITEEFNMFKELEKGLQQNPWPDYLNKHQINSAIVSYSNSKINLTGADVPFALSDINVKFPRSDWALVFWDDTAGVFVRRNKENTSVISKYEYTALWPYNPGQNKYLYEQKAISANTFQREIRRHTNEVPISFLRAKLAFIPQDLAGSQP